MNTTSRFLDADLRLKCLCGCGTIETHKSGLEIIEMMRSDDLEFLYYVVTFDKSDIVANIHASGRIQVRGETNVAVFAFPLLTPLVTGRWDKWRTNADGNRHHFAVKPKQSA